MAEAVAVAVKEVAQSRRSRVIVKMRSAGPPTGRARSSAIAALLRYKRRRKTGFWKSVPKGQLFTLFRSSEERFTVAKTRGRLSKIQTKFLDMSQTNS